MAIVREVIVLRPGFTRKSVSAGQRGTGKVEQLCFGNWTKCEGVLTENKKQDNLNKIVDGRMPTDDQTENIASLVEVITKIN